MQRFMLALVAVLFSLAIAAPSHATLNACAAGKKKCVSKKVAAILKCHIKAETPPKGLAPADLATCIHKARDKFDGGADPTKGCFATLERKFGAACLTTNDTAALEAKVDAFVDDAVCELDPGSGTCQTCSTGQTQCVTGCADLASDPNNCGTCGTVCPTGASCVSGACENKCTPSNCASGCCSPDGTCNPTPNVASCGTLGSICQDCGTGADRCTAGICACGSNPACVPPSPTCGAGNMCQ
jgi:hypothetical protein